jgi:hypothetical protein
MLDEEVVGQEGHESGAEERARSHGWVPRGEFRGNPDNWREAEEYVKLSDTSMPHLKGTLKTMESKMAEQRELIESMKSDFSQFVEMSRSAEQRAYDKAIKDLRAEQQRARDERDMDAFVDATEKLDAKIAEHPTVTGKKPKNQQEEYQEWLAEGEGDWEAWKKENVWYMDDPEMHTYANQMDNYLQAKHGFSKSRAERLKGVKDLVQKKFPDHFGNPARRAGSPVEGDTGGRAPSASNGKGYHDLPDAAKKQCDKWTGKDGKGKAGTIPGLTREDFLKTYKW